MPSEESRPKPRSRNKFGMTKIKTEHHVRKGAGKMPIFSCFLRSAACSISTKLIAWVGHHGTHSSQKSQRRSRVAMFTSSSQFFSIWMKDFPGLNSPPLAMEQASSHSMHPVHRSASKMRILFAVLSAMVRSFHFCMIILKTMLFHSWFLMLHLTRLLSFHDARSGELIAGLEIGLLR